MSDAEPTPTAEPIPTASEKPIDPRQARYEAELAASKSLSVDEFRRLSRRSVLFGGVAVAAGFFGFRGIQKQEEADNIPRLLRATHEFNEDLWRRLYREDHLAKTFPPSEASVLRVNGRHGIREDIDLDAWRLNVDGVGGRIATLDLDAVKALPRHEMTIEHKCVEGWSQVTTWGGARFSDFAESFGSAVEGFDFVSMNTPDREYYVGLDIETMMHPQTLLVYDMMGGDPLDSEHGAPLRLATPLKYGIKQIKRIGTISFTNTQPADFWAERGYDWYSHL